MAMHIGLRFFLKTEKRKNINVQDLKTKKAAEAAKEETIVALDSKTFVPFNIETKEFFEFWYILLYD